MLNGTRSRSRVMWALFALLFAFTLSGSAIAGGLFAIAEYGVRFIPQTISPPNCRNPDRSCIWVNTADNNLYLHTTTGVDQNITTGPTGAFNGQLLTNTSALTGALAASVPMNTIAIVRSTGGGWITYDNATWSPLW